MNGHAMHTIECPTYQVWPSVVFHPTHVRGRNISSRFPVGYSSVSGVQGGFVRQRRATTAGDDESMREGSVPLSAPQRPTRVYEEHGLQ